MNPAGKITSIVAGMPGLFDGVYACATVGQLLREFTHGHSLQSASVARAHLVNLVLETDLLPGIGAGARVFVDIDSLLRPTFGHQKQGASFGHTKIAGRQVLRRGLSPLATTLSTEHGAPVLAGIRLRAGRGGSGKGAASMVTQAIRVARVAGGSGAILARGDSAYGNSAVVRACIKEGAQFSVVLAKNPAVNRAIASIPNDAWVPVHYPGAVEDPDTGALISDAEVAEVEFTAFTSKKQAEQVTARLIVRRVRDANPDHVHVNAQGELFRTWRLNRPGFCGDSEPTEGGVMPAPRKYPNELRERAVRLVREARAEEAELSLNQACKRIGPQVGVSPDTLRGWCKQALVDAGELPGTTTGDGKRIKDLEREVKELKRANEILLAASSFFARELDPRLPW